MANLIKWSALNTFTTAIAGATTAPTLKNLANDATKLGNEIDFSGSGERHRWLALDLQARGAAAFSAGAYVNVWFLHPTDGTNYEDGSDSVTPAKPPDAVLYLRAVNTQQRVGVTGILFAPLKTKFLLQNKGGQAFTNTDNENILSYLTYDEEIQ